MNSKYTFHVIEMEKLDKDEYDHFSNKSVFTTSAWVEFVKNDNQAEPLIVRITQGERFVGYFTALLVKKFGIKILGSPFSGWSTCYMGIDTEYVEEKCKIIKEIVPFLFKYTKCLYMEIIDRDISMEEAIAEGFKAYDVDTLELPIDMDDAALFKQMKTDCRNFIRQFERRGATLEIVEPSDEFAEEYYEQLKDVFAKQGLVPTYSLEKVKCLMRNMKDSDMILCLKVTNPEGRCIATSIFLGTKRKFFFWGGASYRSDQKYRPNEYMIWTAIRYWRERGCNTFDMVGVRDYKRKFGSHEEVYARLVFTKYKFLIVLRDVAKKLYFKSIEWKGKISKKK